MRVGDVQSERRIALNQMVAFLPQNITYAEAHDLVLAPHYEWIVSIAFLAASFVHGVTGFGSGITSMAILPAFLPMMDAVAIVAPFVLMIEVVLAIQLRAALAKPEVRAILPWLCAGSIAGVPSGVTLLCNTDPRLLKMLLGACMMAFVGERAIQACCAARSAEKRSADAAAAGKLLIAAAAERSDDSTSSSTASRRANGNTRPGLFRTLFGLTYDFLQCGYRSPRGVGSNGGLLGEPSKPSNNGVYLDGAGGDHWSSALDKEYSSSAAEDGGTNHPPISCIPGSWSSLRAALSSSAIGVASGVLNGALNEGGPPVIIFVTLQGWPKDDAKATLQFFFLFAQIITIFQLARQDVLGVHHLYYDLVGLPAVALGVGLGICVYDRMDQAVFTRCVIFLMGLAGTAYILKSAIALHDDPVLHSGAGEE